MKSVESTGPSHLPALLLVDDNVELREQMKWGLKSSYEIFEADDRAAAVAMLQKEHMALVTLDLGLPPDADGATEGLRRLGTIAQW